MGSPFDRIFNSSHQPGNIVFNYTGRPFDDLTSFADGYWDAAHALADRFAANPAHADDEGYPVLFLYRHALELYLKAIVYRGASLLGLISQENVSTDRLFHDHSLKKLLSSMQAIARQMKWDFGDSGLASYEEFAKLIRRLDEVDPGSYSFRYPISKSGVPALPHHFVVSVLQFAEVMDRLLRFLSGAAIEIGERWQYEAETKYELEQLASEFWRD
jgi:hypothetical protein